MEQKKIGNLEMILVVGSGACDIRDMSSLVIRSPESQKVNQKDLSVKINMSSPDLTESDIQAVHDVLETRYLSLGPKTKAFEDALSTYSGSKIWRQC